MRAILSWWNESGTVVALLLCIGYFGSRSALAFVPGALLTVFVVGGLAMCIKMAIAHSAPRDEYAEQGGWGDRALWYCVPFLIGTTAVTVLGSML